MTALATEYKPIVSRLIRALRTAAELQPCGTFARGTICGLPLDIGVQDDKALVFTLSNPDAEWSITLSVHERMDSYAKDYSIGDITGNADACVRDLIFAKMALD